MPNPFGNPNFKSKYSEKTKTVRLPESLANYLIANPAVVRSLLEQIISGDVPIISATMLQNSVTELATNTPLHEQVTMLQNNVTALQEALSNNVTTVELTAFKDEILGECVA